MYHWYVPTWFAHDHLSKSEGELKGVNEPSQTTVPALAAAAKKERTEAIAKDFMANNFKKRETAQ